MQKQDDFSCIPYFWVCFADLPMAGLKKYIGKQPVRKKEHDTFPAVSWLYDHIQDTHRYRNSRLLLKALPGTFRRNAA